MQFSSPPFHFYFYPFFHLFRFVFLQSNFPENFIKFQSNSWGISIAILNGFPLLPVSISIFNAIVLVTWLSFLWFYYPSL
jgi:hypothetical protein